MLRNRIIGAIVLAGLLLTGASADVMNLPMPRDYVEDYAGVVDQGTRQRVIALLKELEEKTTAQVIVLTVPSLEGHPLDEVSLHLAHDVWKLGQKGKDNGLLILVAVQDRKYRIEVGYGLEGVLPDSRVGSIGRECFVPNFRSGNYSAGIAAAAERIAGIIAQNAGVALSASAPPSRPQAQAPAEPIQPQPPTNVGYGNSGWAPFFPFLLFVFVFIMFLIGAIRMALAAGGDGVGSSGGWGGFGGGSFGGGGGSFGGGGGGSFGGGGASGSW